MSRKFRWTCEADFPCGKTSPVYVKVAARPNINLEETEKKFLDGSYWIPGKNKYEQITVTYFDVTTDEMTDLYKIIASVYDFTDPNKKLEESFDASKAGTVKLRLLVPDYKCPNCGKSTWGMGLSCSVMRPIEEWVLTEAWPISMNFGDLDYSSSECMTIEVTWRYKNAIYKNVWEELTPDAQNNYKVTQEVPAGSGIGKMGVMERCECQKNSPKTVDQPTTI